MDQDTFAPPQMRLGRYDGGIESDVVAWHAEIADREVDARERPRRVLREKVARHFLEPFLPGW